MTMRKGLQRQKEQKRAAAKTEVFCLLLPRKWSWEYCTVLGKPPLANFECCVAFSCSRHHANSCIVNQGFIQRGGGGGGAWNFPQKS